MKKWIAWAALAVAASASASEDLASKTEAAIERAKTRLATVRAKPAFTAPGAAFDARACAAGKKILAIPVTSAIPFTKVITERMVSNGKEVGLHVQEWQNQGQPSQWAQGIEYAIQNKFDYVSLFSIDPRLIEPQIRAANAAGLKVITTHYYDLSQKPHPLLATSLPIDFNAAGKLLADWAIVQTGGKARVLIVQSDDVVPTGPLVRGIVEELTNNCPECKVVQHLNAGLSEWATKIQPAVQSALIANPDVNFILPIYDSMTQFIVPAVQLTGRQQQVRIASFNGTPFVLDFLQQKKVDMVIGKSLDWIARASIDGYARAICGLPVPAKLEVPFYLFDAANAAEAGTPAQFDKGYGTGYVQGFRQLWKLN